MHDGWQTRTSAEGSGGTGPAGEALARLGLDRARVERALDAHESSRPRMDRLWRYYRNESAGLSGSAGLSQAAGLPSRLAGPRDAGLDDRAERELVIENDIGWRVHAMVEANTRAMAALELSQRRCGLEGTGGPIAAGG